MRAARILIPGGVPHAATCGAGAACEYYEEMSGAFDSVPAGPAATKK